MRALAGANSAFVDAAADKGYDSDALRRQAEDKGAPNIPPQATGVGKIAPRRFSIAIATRLSAYLHASRYFLAQSVLPKPSAIGYVRSLVQHSESPDRGRGRPASDLLPYQHT